MHLSLEIEDRTKAADLLAKLIDDQRLRHESEIASFEDEQQKSLREFIADSKQSQNKLSNDNESLAAKKKDLESQINDLVAKKKDAEASKKNNLDTIRLGIAETKEKAHTAHREQKAQREREWFDKRVSEINKLTWKGNMAKLVSSHLANLKPHCFSSSLTHRHTAQYRTPNTKAQRAL